MKVSLKFLANVLALLAITEHGFAQQTDTGNPADTVAPGTQDLGATFTLDSNTADANTLQGENTAGGIVGNEQTATGFVDQTLVDPAGDGTVGGVNGGGQTSNGVVANGGSLVGGVNGVVANGGSLVGGVNGGGQTSNGVVANGGSLVGGVNGGGQTSNGVVANGGSLGVIEETNVKVSDTNRVNGVQRKPNGGGRGKLSAQRRRMLRSRRLREKIKRLRKGRKNNGKAQAKSTQNVQQPTGDTQPPTAVVEQALPLASNVQTNEVVQLKIQPETQPAQRPSKEQDVFFDFFETTTTGPEVGGPPPEFDPNKPPPKKTMQKVDMSKSTAHDGQPCNATYKPHPTIKTKYMMKYAEGVWETLDCPPNLAEGLVWRQDLCNCGEELRAHDPDDWCGILGYSAFPGNRHKYSRRDHGVDALMDCAANLIWFQQSCQCIYDPTIVEKPIEQKVTFECKKILHLEFEGNLKNKAKGYQVKPVRLSRRGKLPRIRYIRTPGSTNRTAMIVSQPIEFQAFKGNDFQKQVTYALNFKISPRHRARTKFMLLLTDECLSAQRIQGKGRKPSISLGFQPSTKSFRLQFRTTKSEIDQIITGAKPDNNGWYKPVVYFEDGTVNLENNGQKLFSVADILGKVPQNRCPLYIAGRGRGFKRSMDFYGYLDNVVLVKDCKFHEANIKFL